MSDLTFHLSFKVKLRIFAYFVPYLGNRWTDFRNVDINRCILAVGRCTSFRIFEIFIFGNIMAKKLRILAYFWKEGRVTLLLCLLEVWYI